MYFSFLRMMEQLETSQQRMTSQLFTDPQQTKGVFIK